MQAGASSQIFLTKERFLDKYLVIDKSGRIFAPGCAFLTLGFIFFFLQP
jgi:hypothetical protein